MPSSGRISTSVPDRVSICRRVSLRIKIVSICSEIVTTEPSSSDLYSGNSTSTAMMISTPIVFITSIGKFPMRPPSTKSFPSILAGAKTPGTDILARIASVRSPPSSTTASPATISEAIARNGMARSSKSSICDTLNVNSRNRRSSFCPCMTPFGNNRSVPRSPNSKLMGNSRSSCLRRKLRSSRADSSDRAALQFSEPTSSSSSSALMPVA